MNNDLQIPDYLYDLIVEETNLQWHAIRRESFHNFINSFSWLDSRQGSGAWSSYPDTTWIKRRIEKTNWRKINDNDFYVKMMKD